MKSRSHFKEFCDICNKLGLRDVVSFQLNMSVDEVAALSVVSLVQEDGVEHVKQFLTRYVLMPIGEPEEIPEPESGESDE